MSIPRFAIQRPVMMSMLSAIVILLGAISLSRLPVDLLPDISQPSVNVRVNYTGVGPLEMEELVIRPLEQQHIQCLRINDHQYRYGQLVLRSRRNGGFSHDDEALFRNIKRRAAQTLPAFRLAVLRRTAQ